MKYVIAAGAMALGIMAGTPAIAQDYPYRTTTTTVQPNADGSTTVDTTRSKVDAYGNTVKVNTDVNTDPYGDQHVTKRVERDSTDAYGNESKEITDRTTDPVGKQTTTRWQESTTTTTGQ